jgi:hypothetical protein
VHFKDRAAFVDAMHARYHARVEAAVAEAVAGLLLIPGVSPRRAGGRHFFRTVPRRFGLTGPVPLRYGITRSGQVQAAPQGSPSRNRGVFSIDSHDRSRT